MFTDPKFWTATVERAIKTAAQSAVGLVSAGGLGVLDVDWQAVASVSGLAAVVSVLTSVASSQVGDDGPSLAGEVVAPEFDAPLVPVDDEGGDDYQPKHGAD